MHVRQAVDDHPRDVKSIAWVLPDEPRRLISDRTNAHARDA